MFAQKKGQLEVIIKLIYHDLLAIGIHNHLWCAYEPQAYGYWLQCSFFNFAM
jgi:hypothetical protein